MNLPRHDAYDLARGAFDGEQLRIARELRCLTQTEVAKRSVEIGGSRGVSAAAVSQFEAGTSVPTAETIALLVSILEVDPEFLTVRAADSEVHLPAYFRSLRSTPAKQRKRARNVAQLVHRLAAVVARHVEMPARRIPSIPCDPFAHAEKRRRQAEDAAEAVRAEWRLRRGPIDDVIRTVESHGVVCARLQLNEERVDAFSVAFSEFPVAVLAADKNKWDRSRFDVAHELGHIVMHDEGAGVAEAERQANEFSAAFLMPRDEILPQLPTRPDWKRLLDLKAEWGTSVASLLYRARTLGVMEEKTYVGASKVMAARGWKRHEPLNRPIEAPRMLADALRRAKQGGVPLDRLRREAAIPKGLFDEVRAVITS
jgi:Zn-dependent peptidase ImmA (M78 family)/transcriptional regulator with XRE-family HTH domain